MKMRPLLFYLKFRLRLSPNPTAQNAVAGAGAGESARCRMPNIKFSNETASTMHATQNVTMHNANSKFQSGKLK